VADSVRKTGPPKEDGHIAVFKTGAWETTKPRSPLSGRESRGNVDLTLSGRMDGLRATNNPPLVEEIKSVDRFWMAP
jgi:hypothetical protein